MNLAVMRNGKDSLTTKSRRQRASAGATSDGLFCMPTCVMLIQKEAREECPVTMIVILTLFAKYICLLYTFDVWRIRADERYTSASSAYFYQKYIIFRRL